MFKRFSFFVILLSCLVSAGAIFYFFSFSETEKFSSLSPEKILSAKEIKVKSGTIAAVSSTSFLEDTISSSTVSLLAFGDIMLDRSVMLKTQAAQNYNHPFLLIDPLLKEYNLHLANLEGPITNNKSVANGTGGARFTFTFSPKFVEPLKNRFEFLSLANNHEYNFGQAGVDATRKFLGDAGVHYFGDPGNDQNFIVTTSSYNGITLGFVGYHQLIEKGFENVLSEIERIRPEVDVLIAMPHWGIEYVTNTPSYLQKQEGHKMIDAGVDSIIGAHPHVIEPIEIYKDKVIFYSLGNFIFDQYFSEETQTGLAVGIVIKKIDQKIQLEYKLIPLDINGQSQASVATPQKTQRTLNFLSSVSIVSDEKKQDIKQGIFSVNQ